MLRFATAKGACATGRAAVLLAACILVAAATQARADVIVQFQLDSIGFADGGSAVGTFTIDEDTGYVSDTDITVTDALATESPDVFDDSTVTSQFDASGLTLSVFSNNGDSFGLTFENVASLADDPIASGAYSYDGGLTSTIVVAGSIAPTPEPATLPLFGAALGLLLLTCRTFRRRAMPSPA